MGRRAGALLLLVGGLACADEPGTVPDAASPDASTNGDGAAPDTASGVDARAEDATVAAPPLDPGLPTSFAEGTAFLYSGEAPLQTGVAPGTIDPGRVAVLRGKVITRDGDPLEGVTVAILGHPELGRTQTRRDGWFDLAVNGGGALTVTYARSGFLPAQRGVIAPWLDYRHLPDVALIVKDPMVTPINLNAPAMQVARASVQNDADGARRATVLFPAGTGAELVQPDGSTRPASTLNVRLTEYTVGVNGPAAMPGQLPPTSGYTYAVELGADEAVAKVDGRDVIFSQPVLLYLENFVDIPVGEVVPAGYYDPDRGSWFAADNGLVLAVVGVNAGLADLDVTGDGVGDGAASLATYNITDSERAELARLYPPGTTLWRTPLDHFSTIDCNWSVICSPGGCSPPQQPPPPPPVQCNSPQGGS